MDRHLACIPPRHSLSPSDGERARVRGFVRWGGRRVLFSCFLIFVSANHYRFLPVIAAPHTNANPPGSSACGASAGKPARADGEFALRTGSHRTASRAGSILMAQQHQPPRQEVLPSRRIPNHSSIWIHCSRSCHWVNNRSHNYPALFFEPQPAGQAIHYIRVPNRPFFPNPQYPPK
jgi:hypothetical protein